MAMILLNYSGNDDLNMSNTILEINTIKLLLTLFSN